MLNRLMQQFNFIKESLRKEKDDAESNNTDQSKKEELSKSLATNLEKLRSTLGSSNDIVIREFNIGLDNGPEACLLFIDGLVNKEMINEDIMRAIMIDSRIIEDTVSVKKHHLLDVLKENSLFTCELKEVYTFEEVIQAILSGETIVLVDGYESGLQLGTRGWDYRAISEPQTEAVVRGPREGFTETLRVNTALLRRKIKDPNLTFESTKIGEVTKTDVSIAYVKGIANLKVVEEIKKRLARIKIDGILESGQIEQLIEDAPLSIFATVGNSEKPDVTAAKLLDGKVAIMTDGTPIVLIVPYLFIESVQNSEDYYSRPWYSSLIRWIRFAALGITLFLPAIYIVSQSYHHEMIPTILLITMAAARSGVPFPVLVETLLMALAF
ncbi:MAG: spore germination protein, partial [Peptostreptococcales bacterium]